MSKQMLKFADKFFRLMTMTRFAQTTVYSWLTILALVFGSGFNTATAQKRNQKSTPKSAQKTSTVKTTAPTDKRTEAQKLMNDYRFDEAATLLEAEIKKETKAKRSTALLEDELRHARIGAQMLTATERVCFIDSTVVARKDFFNAYKISAECGRIAPLANLLSGKTIDVDTKTVGVTAYLNSLGDRLYFALPDSTGLMKLNVSIKTSSQWGEPQQLQGMGSSDDMQDYPYMMADGVTLYYAAQTSDGLGGYDIFVTRANSDETHFVKAENVGMPFNSPANDYLMAIDEENNIGWFVSDRNQSTDSVCIYCFVPSETREVYDLSTTDKAALRRYARIASIEESQRAAIKETPALEATAGEAKNKLQELKASTRGASNQSAQGETPRFVIGDARVYTALSQFHNATARSIAQEVLSLKQAISEKEAKLESLRESYHSAQSNRTSSRTGSQVGNGILKAEKELQQLYSLCMEKEKTMRRVELGR